jgi:GNAT superfamily N-acetyltransferase
MNIKLREAVEKDKNVFVEFTVKLSKFNRGNHSDECKYDDYESVLISIKNRAEEIFNNTSEDTLILIAELEGSPVGYALGKIFQQDETADNGTGFMGLFDELFIDNTARGYGIGQKLIDEMMKWMKDKGVNRVKLQAYSWNNNAKRIYEQNGFKEYAVSYEKFI